MIVYQPIKIGGFITLVYKYKGKGNWYNVSIIIIPMMSMAERWWLKLKIAHGKKCFHGGAESFAES